MKRKLPPDDVVVSMYRSGMSSLQIAEQFGVTASNVRALLRRIGEPRRTISDALKLSYANGVSTPTSYWTGKTQPAEMIERRISKIRGERHYLWNGGHSRRPYRNLVTKEKCERCGGTKDLGIHHQDDDHYNNDVKNLVVLCLSCHMSIHKTAYWKAWREGKPLPKSNAPTGWLKRDRTTS